MSDSPLSRKQIGKYYAEFAGTAMLTLVIKMSAGQGEMFAAFAIGFVLMCLVSIGGYISGAMYNPSVTTAFVVVNQDVLPRSNVLQIVMYYCMQYLGGLAGAFLASLIGGEDVAGLAPELSDNAELYQAFFAELVFTFLLCVVILHVAVNQKGNQFYPMAIGFTLFVGVVCIGRISGCCLNSAVWFGAYLAALSVRDPSTRGIWIYWIATLLGGLMAGLGFHLMYLPEQGRRKHVETTEITRISKDEETGAGDNTETDTLMDNQETESND